MDKNKPLIELISLAGKTAVITGAAAGMGAATAYRFAEAGANLHLLDIDAAGVTAVYWMCQHFIRQRKENKQNGVIVNVSSIEAHLPFKEDLAHYTTGKAAVIALTRALARDYGRSGIRANVILPGGIITQGTRAAARQAWKSPGLIRDGINFKARLPLGRMGQPDEVARVSLVLASDLTNYMTDAVIPVDGGFLSA